MGCGHLKPLDGMPAPMISFKSSVSDNLPMLPAQCSWRFFTVSFPTESAECLEQCLCPGPPYQPNMPSVTWQPLDAAFQESAISNSIIPRCCRWRLQNHSTNAKVEDFHFQILPMTAEGKLILACGRMRMPSRSFASDLGIPQTQHI